MALTRLCKSNATKSDFDRAHPDVWPHGGKAFFLQGLHLHMGLISMPLRMCIMIFGKTNDYDEIHNVCTLYIHNRTENDGKSVWLGMKYFACCLYHIPIKLHVIYSLSCQFQKIPCSLEIYMIISRSLR